MGDSWAGGNAQHHQRGTLSADGLPLSAVGLPLSANWHLSAPVPLSTSTKILRLRLRMTMGEKEIP